MIEGFIETITDQIDFQDIFFTEASSSETLIGIENLGDSFDDLLYDINDTKRDLFYLRPGVNTSLTAEEIQAHIRHLDSLKGEASSALRKTAYEYSDIVHAETNEALEKEIEHYNNTTKHELKETMREIKSELSRIRTDIHMHGGKGI